jgi:predicted ATPase
MTSFPLPMELTSFIGRQRELAEVRRLLELTRLLTLTGAGGVGKTRLALRVARDIRDRGLSRAALVEFAALENPEQVLETVASALRIPFHSNRPALAVLTNVLRHWPLLLVLDNCEHIVEAVAVLAEHLLRNCPQLTIVATSREALGVAGETTWRVPSLSLPALDSPATLQEVQQSEAVQLFLQRAAAAQPEFALTERNAPAIVTLTRRLDGIPLALELAAARVTVLSAEQIAARLDHALLLLTSGSRTAPARQQTLRATLDWSVKLLSRREQQLFERLSVFPAAGLWRRPSRSHAGRVSTAKRSWTS